MKKFARPTIISVAVIALGFVSASTASAATTRTAPYDYSSYCGDLTGCQSSDADHLVPGDGADTSTQDPILQSVREGHLKLATVEVGDGPVYESTAGIYFTPDPEHATDVTVQLDEKIVINPGGATLTLCAGFCEWGGVNFVDQRSPQPGQTTFKVTVPPFKGSPRFLARVTLFNGSGSLAGPILADVNSITIAIRSSV